MRIYGFLVLLACLALIGLVIFHTSWLPRRYDPSQPLDLEDKWSAMSSVKLRILAHSGSLCRSALRTAPFHFQNHDHAGTTACPLLDVWTIRHSALRSEPQSFLASCNLAVRWILFEKNVAQPVTQEILGTELKGIRHLGSFACRTIRDQPDSQSSHATADAIDVSEFILANGQKIPVSDWSKGGQNSRYLHTIRDRACQFFRTVLSPDYNILHASHFHFQATGLGFCR